MADMAKEIVEANGFSNGDVIFLIHLSICFVVAALYIY